MVCASLKMVVFGLTLLGVTEACADETLTYTVQGAPRSAILHVPLTAIGRASPLVVVMYGSGDNAANFQKNSGFDAVADKDNFIAVYPEAIDAHWDYERVGPRAPVINGQPVDDVGFLRMMIDDLVSRNIADKTKVYATGFSRGALMSYTLACAMPDKIAAIAPVGSPMTEAQADACKPAHPLPIMMINGTSDPVQLYDGWLYPDGRLLSVPETLDYWRRSDGCTGEEGKELPHLDNEDRTRASVFNWTGCNSGTGVRFFRIADGGHRWPRLQGSGSDETEESKRSGRRSRDIETPVEVWGFLNQYQLPK